MIDTLKQKISSREQFLKDEVNSDSLKVSNLNGKRTALVSQINSLKVKKENSNIEDLKEKFAQKNSEKELILDQINSLSETISNDKFNLNELYKELADKRESVSSLQNYKNIEIQKVEQKYNPKSIEVNSEISSLIAYINKAESIKDICPTCGQKLVGVEKIDCSNERHKLVLAKENKTKLNTDKQLEIDEIISKYDSMISEENKNLENHKVKYNDLDNTIKKSEYQLSCYQTTERSLSSELSILESQIKAIDLVDYDSQIREMEKEVETIDSSLLYINKEVEDLTKRVSIISKFQTFVKRDFRGYLLDQYINFLNKTAKRYCSSLFGSDKILISLDGNNLSISYSDKEYESLSGGEKQKVDLLVQFSIREMLRSILNFSSNILVLDEITDNLDAEGCQKLIDFISTSFGDLEGIYLISHRKDLDIPYDYMINVVKNELGISEIV